MDRVLLNLGRSLQSCRALCAGPLAGMLLGDARSGLLSLRGLHGAPVSLEPLALHHHACTSLRPYQQASPRQTLLSWLPFSARGYASANNLVPRFVGGKMKTPA